MTADLEKIAEEMEGHLGKTQARAGTIIGNYKWAARIRAWIAANKESPQRKAFVEAAMKLARIQVTSFADQEAVRYGDAFRDVERTYRAMIEAERP